MFNVGKLARENSGVTIIEFAVVAPVMFLFIGGLLELGYVAFARSTLESAILDASRASKVTDCPTENASLIEEKLEERMSVVRSSDGNPPILTVQSYGADFRNVGNPEPFNDIDGNGQHDIGEPYTDTNGNGKWDPDMGKDGNYGNFGDVVRFSATYNVVSILPFISSKINKNDGFHPITVVTVVRNEPYKDVSC